MTRGSCPQEGFLKINAGSACRRAVKQRQGVPVKLISPPGPVNPTTRANTPPQNIFNPLTMGPTIYTAMEEGDDFRRRIFLLSGLKRFEVRGFGVRGIKFKFDVKAGSFTIAEKEFCNLDTLDLELSNLEHSNHAIHITFVQKHASIVLYHNCRTGTDN